MLAPLSGKMSKVTGCIFEISGDTFAGISCKVLGEENESAFATRELVVDGLRQTVAVWLQVAISAGFTPRKTL